MHGERNDVEPVAARREMGKVDRTVEMLRQSQQMPLPFLQPLTLAAYGGTHCGDVVELDHRVLEDLQDFRTVTLAIGHFMRSTVIQRLCSYILLWSSVATTLFEF